MTLRVLQGGKRRRHYGRVWFAVGAIAVFGAALAAWHLWPSGGPGSVAPAAAKPPPKPVRPAVHTRAAEPILAVRHPLARGLRIGAPAGVLVDAGDGTVLWAKRPNLRLPIASTTKIMTAVVALSRLRGRDVVVVDPSVPRVAPFKEGLRAGEHVKAWKLFYGLLLYSGNDDALALAIATAGGRKAFVALMNREAAALGLRDSHFSSSSGVIDDENYASAWDIAALTRYAFRDARLTATRRRPSRARGSARRSASSSSRTSCRPPRRRRP